MAKKTIQEQIKARMFGFTSQEPERAILNCVMQQGDDWIATDGRVMLVVKHMNTSGDVLHAPSKWGKKRTEYFNDDNNSFMPKEGESRAYAEDNKFRIPDWKQSIPDITTLHKNGSNKGKSEWKSYDLPNYTMTHLLHGVPVGKVKSKVIFEGMHRLIKTVHLTFEGEGLGGICLAAPYMRTIDKWLEKEDLGFTMHYCDALSPILIQPHTHGCWGIVLMPMRCV